MKKTHIVRSLVMLAKSIFGKSALAVLPIFVFAGTTLSPVSVCASTINYADASITGMDHGRPDKKLFFEGTELPRSPVNTSMIVLPSGGRPGMGTGRPEHVPPFNPPIVTPAFYNGLVNTPALMPPSVPSHTLPGSGFGQAVVPVPAAVWLFGSGLLGLIGIAGNKRRT